jgi:formylglycine-generating enzyme required for sulfatase activity
LNSDRIERLLECIRDPSRSIEERGAAGDELAERGDPRLQRELVQLAAHGDIGAFAMDPFLVTVSDYAAFIDDGGYDDASLWSADGWSWRTKQRIDEPRFWDDPEWALYQVANHPIVGVSAFEAEAYAQHRSCALPTVAQWERACRGDDGRAFPWGEDWQDDACAHRGYGPRSTLPVGIFPQSVSPHGLHDLVGSVWQWTADPLEGDHGVELVTCGGAWNNKAWSIGAAGRNAFPRDARFSNLGFRVISST